MWSNFIFPFSTVYQLKTTGYCYHSVNVIIFDLAKSDHIKRFLLYLQPKAQSKMPILKSCWYIWRDKKIRKNVEVYPEFPSRRNSTNWISIEKYGRRGLFQYLHVERYTIFMAFTLIKLGKKTRVKILFSSSRSFLLKKRL